MKQIKKKEKKFNHVVKVELDIYGQNVNYVTYLINRMPDGFILKHL